MTLYKICAYAPCHQRFERPEGMNSFSWKIKKYCSTDCKDKQSLEIKLKKDRAARKSKLAYQRERLAEQDGQYTRNLQSLLSRTWI